MAGQYGFAVLRLFVVQHEIVPLPSGRFVTVDVNEQHHPVAVGRRGQLIGGFDVKINVPAIAGHFRVHDVVAPGRIGIKHVRMTFVIPVHRIARIMPEIGRYAVPTVETADPEAPGLRHRLRLRNALVTADIVDQLDVIGIALIAPRLDRFDIAAAFPVELIGECKRIIGAGGMPADVLPGDEFVPAGNENQVGIALQRIIPLLLDIQSVQVSILAGILPALLGITAPVSSRRIESTAVAAAGIVRILRHADHHLFAAAVRTFDKLMLRIGFEPTPLVGTPGAVHDVGLTGTEREKIADRPVFGRIGQVVRISHDTGFAVQVKPKVFGPARLVNILIKLAQRNERPIHRPERQHERNLRHIHAVPLRLRPDVDQYVVRRFPGKGSVRTVEKHDVHTGIGQHFGMFAQHPRVGRLVIPQQRLVPEIRISADIPGGVVVIVDRLGMFAENLRNVADPPVVGNRTGVPRPVKHRHFAVVSAGAGLFPPGQSAAETVRRGPLVALDRRGGRPFRPKNQSGRNDTYKK